MWIEGTFGLTLHGRALVYSLLRDSFLFLDVLLISVACLLSLAAQFTRGCSLRPYFLSADGNVCTHGRTLRKMIGVGTSYVRTAVVGVTGWREAFCALMVPRNILRYYHVAFKLLLVFVPRDV